MIICSRCQEPKPREDMGKNRSAPGGLSSWCKACGAAHKKASRAADPERHRANWQRSCAKHREARRLRSRARYAKMLAERTPEEMRTWRRGQQNYPTPTRPEPALCECCGRPPCTQGMHLDHCHETGAFRGWLCSGCNMAIGRLGDNHAGIMQAATYLLRAAR